MSRPAAIIYKTCIKKKVVSRQPIFLNLKSNTMKNTVQRYVILQDICKYSAKKMHAINTI